MNLKDLKKNIQEHYPEAERRIKYDLAFHLGRNLLEARLAVGMTQTQLAKLVKTHQPNIARIENGSTIPTLVFLQNLAVAMGTYLVAPTFGNILSSDSIKLTAYSTTNRTGPIISTYAKHFSMPTWQTSTSNNQTSYGNKN